MKKIEMEVVDIALSGSSSGAYAMVLGEKSGGRKLPIVIGGAEAQAIAIEMEKMKASRPLTHDLFKAAFDAYHLEISEVLIYNMVEGIFYAKLICTDGSREAEIDARPSDAVALAYRFNCPIFVYDAVLDSAGIRPDEMDEDSDALDFEQEQEIPEVPQESHMSLAELQRELAQAIEREEYERAARLRNELQKRQGHDE
jgi:bifunctional DNase/RNase